MPSDLVQNKLAFDWQREIQKLNPRCTNALEIELIAFRYGTKHGRFFHMQRLADFFYSKECNPDILRPLIWNPWTISICRLLCDGDEKLSFTGYPDVVGVTGPASSSKTFSVALYIFLLWYSNPLQTKGVISSTSITAAKNKIWADVLQFAMAVPAPLQFYEILNSNPAIIKLPKGTSGATSRESIELIAGDDSQRDASDKVLGIKNSWFILGVDEATEVSHALYAARDNVSKNPRYQMIFIGNAKSHDDPHGMVCEPADGWDSITVEDTIWETTQPRGACIHLDGTKSPNLNIPDGHPLPYPGLFSSKDLAPSGESSIGGHVRFVRGFWAKSGTVNQIYTPQDIELNGGQEKAIWLEKPRRLIGHDPSFSTDGDAAKVVIVDVGMTPERLPIIAHVATEQIEVEEAEDKRRGHAMAERLEVIAKKYGIVSLSDIGVDNTGTGTSYPEIIDEVFKKAGWEGHCTRVPFNGPVSDSPYPSDDLTEPGEMFDRRVSELWYVGKLFLQKRQMRGLRDSLVKDMCKRLYDRGRQNKIVVETKRKMRERGISSPDEGDSFFIALDLARSKLGFAVYKGEVGPQRPKRTFKDWAKKYGQEIQGKQLQVEYGRDGGWFGKSLKS